MNHQNRIYVWEIKGIDGEFDPGNEARRWQAKTLNSLYVLPTTSNSQLIFCYLAIYEKC